MSSRWLMALIVAAAVSGVLYDAGAPSEVVYILRNVARQLVGG